MGKLRRIRALRARFHVEELIAQRAELAFEKSLRDVRQERVSHPGPGTMGQNVAGDRTRCFLEQAGDLLRIIDRYHNRFWPGRGRGDFVMRRAHKSVWRTTAADAKRRSLNDSVASMGAPCQVTIAEATLIQRPFTG